MGVEIPIDILDMHYSPTQAFPNKVRLIRFGFDDQNEIYVKRSYCYAKVYMLDDDNTVGKTVCSNCEEPIDPFTKYCSNCGAKVKGRITFDKEGHEIDRSSLYLR